MNNHGRFIRIAYYPTFLLKISVKPKILVEYKELGERDDTLVAFAYERTEDRANGWTEKMNGQREINKRSRPDSFLGYEEHRK